MTRRAPQSPCPRCGSGKIARIQYGEPAPSPTLDDDIASGRIVLGGCVVDEDAPQYRCGTCGLDFPAPSVTAVSTSSGSETISATILPHGPRPGSRAYDLGHTVQALTALGEIRLRQGDLAAARKAFDRAAEFGLPPGPGHALVLLAEGDGPAAVAAITRALQAAGGDPLSRARYLPAAVEIALAAGDRDGARTRSAELANIAAAFPGPVLAATVVACQGGIRLADGDAAGAITLVRDAAIRWRSVGSPYESARCRMLVASAAAALGDRGEAAREARVALTSFSELGAERDIEAAAAFLDQLDPSAT